MYRLAAVSIFLLALLSGCVAPPAGPRIDNIPMYGQPSITRPDFLQKADADFILNASSAFGGDRQAASREWAGQASRFLAQGNLDFAMRRYNQAWLLDDTNYEVYWGFARVGVESDNFETGVKFMKQAVELCRDDFQLPAVYSDLGVAFSFLANSVPHERASERSAAFASANDAFAKSIALSPKYANAWRRWSISLAMERKYSEAAVKAQRAKEMGAPPLPPKLAKEIEDAVALTNGAQK